MSLRHRNEQLLIELAAKTSELSSARIRCSSLTDDSSRLQNNLEQITVQYTEAVRAADVLRQQCATDALQHNMALQHAQENITALQTERDNLATRVCELERQAAVTEALYKSNEAEYNRRLDDVIQARQMYVLLLL